MRRAIFLKWMDNIKKEFLHKMTAKRPGVSATSRTRYGKPHPAMTSLLESFVCIRNLHHDITAGQSLHNAITGHAHMLQKDFFFACGQEAGQQLIQLVFC